MNDLRIVDNQLSAKVSFHQFDLSGLEAAVCGSFPRSGSKAPMPATLGFCSSELHYWGGLPTDHWRRPLDRQYFVATTKQLYGLPIEARADMAQRNLRRVVGVLSGFVAPSHPRYWSLEYVTVANTSLFRQRGISKQLYTNMLAYLRMRDLNLARTQPGLHTPPQFTRSVTRLIEQAGVQAVPWAELYESSFHQ